MRRVAQELNVGTMSLYYYVKTKKELIAVMDDALMSLTSYLPSVPENWRRDRGDCYPNSLDASAPSLGPHFDAVGSSWTQCDAPYGAMP